MAKHYPHKQTVLIAIACAAAVGVTMAYVHWQKAPVQEALVANGSIDAQPVAIASDSDAWKKAFLGTSTDSSAITSINKTKSPTEELSNTLTAKTSRDFFAEFIDLKKNGFDTNEQLKQGVIEQTVDSVSNGSKQAKAYVLRDINVSAKSDIVSAHDYGNSIAALLVTYLPKQNAPTIAENAFENGDMSLLSSIDPIILSYQKIEKALLSMEVPQPMTAYHLDLLNSVSGMISISQGLRDIETDPLQSMASLSSYTGVESQLTGSLLGMKSYFESNHVAFAAGEPGALFATVSISTQ